MSKVTSKLQVTLPKVVADQLGIKPGDQIEWEIAGETLRVIPASKQKLRKRDIPERLRLFDHATERQKKRAKSIDSALLKTAEMGRGWTREDLYSRSGNRAPDSKRQRV